MSYLYQPSGRSIRILNPEAGFIFGYIDLSQGDYRVKSPEGRTVAVVKSLDDALPALVDHHEKHPARWERDSPTAYAKDTPYGLLSVTQEPLGFWSVYRNHHIILLRDGKPAAFRTADEAKVASDAHMRDEVGKVSDDGFEWFSMAS